MIAALDSATPPTPTAVAAARAAGVHIWSGYLATRAGVNLLRPWTRAEFEIARGCGGTPLAFASGLDDPRAIATVAASWTVRPCLDVETGILGDGAWVQAWLDASGAGLYGNPSVHTGRRAAFHVVAAYGLDPSATWPTRWPRPAAPCGWQWQGSHSEFGMSVDRSWLDDWFGGEDSMRIEVARGLVQLAFGTFLGRTPATAAERDAWADRLVADEGQTEEVINEISQSPEGKAWALKLHAIGSPGPAGPPGPVGPPGPPGPTADLPPSAEATVLFK